MCLLFVFIVVDVNDCINLSMHRLCVSGIYKRICRFGYIQLQLDDLELCACASVFNMEL